MNRRAYQAALWLSVGLVVVIALAPIRAEDDTRPKDNVRDGEDAQTKEALWLADRAKLVQKVHTLVIGDVDLKDATIEQVIDFLRRQSKLSDPDHQGINFIANHKTPDLETYRFNVKLKNATVEDVLAHLLMVGATISDFTVDLEDSWGDRMYSRTFHVPDNVLAINPSMLTDKDKQIYDVKSLFQAKGIKFSPGAEAVYALPAKTLTVVFGDPEDIIRVDELLVFGFKDHK